MITHAALDILPPVARSMAVTLRAEFDAQHDHVQSLTRRLADATRKVDAIRNLIATGKATDADRELLPLLEGDVAALRTAQKTAQASENSTRYAVGAVSNYITPLLPAPGMASRHKIVDVPRPSPKSDLDSVRASIAGVIAQIREVERSTLSREELEPRVRRLVTDMGERGAISIVGLDGRAHMRLTSRASKPTEVLAWLFPEETIQRLLSSVPDGGTTSEERRAQLTSLTDKLDKLERQEAALVIASGADWRKGIGGAAVLSIEVRS